MSIHFMVLGFEPTTFGKESPPTTARPGLPPKTMISLLVRFSLVKLEAQNFKTLNKPNVNLPKADKMLQKWRNFAKSGHTGH